MKRLIILIPMLMLISTLPASAAVTDEDFTQLKQELFRLIQRVESLENENTQLRANVESVQRTQSVETAETLPVKRSWTDTIAISGDIRTRYEHIDAEGRDVRERSRVRARIAVKAKPTDNLELAVGIATGGDDPISRNQSFGGGASTKDARLELAYFKWQAKPGLNILGGKMKNIWVRPAGHSLLWDGDYNPEGFAVTWASDQFFINSGLHFIESDTRRSNARLSYGLQTGWNGNIGDAKLTAGVSYFKMGVEGQSAYYDDGFFGNSTVCTAASCVYANDYEELELFVDLATTLGNRPFSVFADIVQNQDVSTDDTGWAAGVKLGKASSANTWELIYRYQKLEADAVFGLWTDSDLGGGGTGTKGHQIRGAWALNKKMKLGFTYFDTVSDIDSASEADYNRFMLDWSFKL